MKLKLVIVMFLFGVSFNIINALDYAITFKGQGATNVIDTIKVVNISQNTSLTFSGNSVLHLVSNVTEIKQVTGYNLNEIRFYPNPMNDYCLMEFDLPKGGNTLVQLFDVSGRLLTERKTILNAGIQTFRISGILNGVYFARVSAGDNTFLGKLVSTGGNINQPHISYEKTIPANAVTFILKSAPNEVEMNYNDGDTLLFTFVSGYLKTTLIDVPTESKTLIANFAENVDLQNGLVAYYPFNGNANDESGNGHHAFVNGSTLTSDRFSNQDNAYYFDSSAYFEITNNPNLNLRNADCFTMVWWFKANIYQNSMPVLDTNVIFKPYSAQLASLNEFIARMTLNDNKWHMATIIIKWDSNMAELYIDDAFDTIFSNNKFIGLIKSSKVSLKYIAGYLLKKYFIGKIDDIRLYNRGLNADEISTLYHEEGFPGELPSVVTLPARNITQTTATIGPLHISGIEIIGVCWGTTPNLDTSNTKVITNDLYELSNLTPGTTYYIRAFAINNAGLGYGKELSFTTTNIIDYDSISDIDDNIYKTVKIGKQIWMAENLGTTKYNDGSPLIPNNSAYCENCDFIMDDYYKGYYRWNTVATEKLCPAGWHVPFDMEWTELLDFVGGNGNLLKDVGTWSSYCDDDGHGVFCASDDVIDLYGFSALEAGKYELIHSQIQLYEEDNLFGHGFNAYFWSSSENTNDTAWGRKFDYKSQNVTRLKISKDDYCSIRCIKDSVAPQPVLLLTTHLITNVNFNSATCGGVIISDGGLPVNAHGVCWSNSPNPDTSDFKTYDGDGIEDFSSTLTGLIPNTVYYVRAYAINSAGVGYGNELSFTTLPEIVYGSVTDIEVNVYKTVEIGNQTWMAENLRTTKYNDGTPIPYLSFESFDVWPNPGYYCNYDHDTNIAALYGRFYGGWGTNNKICPVGWHPSTYEDWIELETFLGGSEIAGGKLKESDTNYWKSPNTGADNSTGFSALPGGSVVIHSVDYEEKYIGLSFGGLGFRALYWTDTPKIEDPEWLYTHKNASLAYNNSKVVHPYCIDWCPDLFSVRCVKD